MPEENPILTYWRSELDVFNKNLLLLREKMDEEAVHDLRVAIKKLRSCFKIYSELVSKKNKNGLPASIDSLFSILGKQRDIEMSKKLLLALGGKNATFLNHMLVYLQLLQDQAGEYSRPSIQQLDPAKFSVLTNQMQMGLSKLDEQELLSRSREIVNASVEKVEDDLKHFKERSHLVRKKLKEIFYQSKMFHGEGTFNKSELKILDTILDHLGNVHDHEVLISNLKNFRKTILDNKMKEYAMIKRIEGRAKKRKDDLLDKAYTAAEKLVSDHKKDGHENQEPHE